MDKEAGVAQDVLMYCRYHCRDTVWCTYLLLTIGRYSLMRNCLAMKCVDYLCEIYATY